MNFISIIARRSIALFIIRQRFVTEQKDKTTKREVTHILGSKTMQFFVPNKSIVELSY